MSTQHPILQKLEDASRLPSPPLVALKIVEVVRDPDSGVSDIADVIRLDPVIAAKLLQISNSSSYSRGRKIATLTDAVNLLGLKSISIIALGFSLKESLPVSNALDLDDDVLWKHSVATGVACRSLSRFVGNANDEMAFMCGLLSRIGQLVFVSVFPDSYAEVIEAAEHLLPTADEETTVMGINHHQVSTKLLEKWQLPAAIIQAVARWNDLDLHSADSELDPEVRQLAGMIKVGDIVRGLLFEENKAAALETIHAMASEMFGLTQSEVDRIFVNCQIELNETLGVFTENDIADIDCESILAEAKEQLVRLSIELAQDVTNSRQKCDELKQSNSELRVQCAIDALTGLPNRYALEQEFDGLDATIASSKTGRQYSIVMLDVDHFKAINDTHGHATGDLVLRCVGKALDECSRSTDFVARYGGEEFTVILPNCDSTQAVAVADRFRRAIERQFVELEKTGVASITLSAGVASSDNFPDATSCNEILKCADGALYSAKHLGRNQTAQYHEAELQTSTAD